MRHNRAFLSAGKTVVGGVKEERRCYLSSRFASIQVCTRHLEDGTKCRWEEDGDGNDNMSPSKFNFNF